MAATLQPTSSFPARFYAYLLERFPPLNGLMFFIFFLTCYILTAFLSAPQQPVALSPKLLAGFAAVYFFFFRLRVFDEHKDYELDCRNHPHRVLQSGLITLANLRAIAIFGVLVEAGVSWWFSPVVFTWWLVAFIYSLLMAKEFFAHEWLEPKLFLYALSHMLIMPIMVVWIASMARPEGDLPLEVLFLGLLSFFSGMAFEICRKIKAPEDEKAGILTYSRIFGTRRAPVVAFGCLLISSLMLAYLLLQIGVGMFLLAVVFGLLLFCGYIFLNFIRKSTPKNAKMLELGSSLFMLAAYILVISAALYKTGVQWV